MSDGMNDSRVHYGESVDIEEAGSYKLKHKTVAQRRWDGWGEWYEVVEGPFYGMSAGTLDKLKDAICVRLREAKRFAQEA